MAGHKTLFLIDDIIADKTVDKRRQPLLGLAISGRHKGYLLWLLTHSYTAIPMNIRRQAKMLCLVSKEARRLEYDSQREQCHRNTRRSSEQQEEAETGQTHLFSNENGTFKSLQDSLSIVTKLLQDSCQETTAHLRDTCQDSYTTPTGCLHHTYKTHTAHLPRDCRTPAGHLTGNCGTHTGCWSTK